MIIDATNGKKERYLGVSEKVLPEMYEVPKYVWSLKSQGTTPIGKWKTAERYHCKTT